VTYQIQIAPEGNKKCFRSRSV